MLCSVLREYLTEERSREQAAARGEDSYMPKRRVCVCNVFFKSFNMQVGSVPHAQNKHSASLTSLSGVKRTRRESRLFRLKSFLPQSEQLAE